MTAILSSLQPIVVHTPAIPEPQFIRLACRLHAALVQRSHRDAALEQSFHRVSLRLEPYLRAHKRHGRALDRGWTTAARHTGRELLDRLIDLRHTVAEAYPGLNTSRESSGLSANGVHAPPSSPAVLLEELRSLFQEFDDPQHEPRAQTLSIVTEPITLEEVSLGRFRITLHLERLLSGGRMNGDAFDVEALDPNPASGDESIPHPHVRDRSVCLGDATTSIQTALQQGRIADAFRLVERVLLTYNPASPYRLLREWSDIACEDCGERVGSDEIASCSNCGNEVCGGCEQVCDGCESTFCSRCVIRISGGSNGEERRACAECRGHCHACDRIELDSVLDEHDGMCEACDAAHQEQIEEDQEEEEEEEVLDHSAADDLTVPQPSSAEAVSLPA